MWNYTKKKSCRTIKENPLNKFHKRKWVSLKSINKRIYIEFSRAKRRTRRSEFENQEVEGIYLYWEDLSMYFTILS